MKFVARLFPLLLSLSLVVLPFLVNPSLANAATFNPSFGVTLSDSTPGNSSNVEFRVTNPSESEIVSNFNFQIPAGWQLNGGSSFAENDQLGSGSFTAVFGGNELTFPFVIKNKTDLQGHKLHILADFSPVPITVNVFIDGDNASGHSFSVTPPGGNDLPSELVFTLFGQSSGGVPFVVNPNVQGDYVWTANFTSTSGANVSRSQTLSIPGTVTPVGDDVAVTLSDGSSVTFDSVTGEGVTTISTSETAPPEGTGQFQLGGLYYDFDTTATFSCPCTVTIPYDPDLVSDPRIYHQEVGVWVDVTTNVDTVNHLVTGVVSSFSFFAPGQANFGLEFLDPVAALMKKSNPIELNKNQTLPVQFTLADADGNFVTNSDVSIQVVNASDNILITQIPAEIKNERYKANLDLKSLNLAVGDYKIRVKVGNTIYSPYPLFTIK